MLEENNIIPIDHNGARVHLSRARNAITDPTHANLYVAMCAINRVEQILNIMDERTKEEACKKNEN